MTSKNQETTETKTQTEIVKIGNKPAISYILAAMTCFSQGAKSVILKARGNSISTAVSVEENVKRRLNLGEPTVKLSTDELEQQDRDDATKTHKVKVSVIEITLKSLS